MTSAWVMTAQVSDDHLPQLASLLSRATLRIAPWIPAKGTDAMRCCLPRITRPIPTGRSSPNTTGAATSTCSERSVTRIDEGGIRRRCWPAQNICEPRSLVETVQSCGGCRFVVPCSLRPTSASLERRLACSTCSPDAVSSAWGTMRYTLLCLYGVVGLMACYVQVESSSALRGAAVGVLILWACLQAMTDSRRVAEYI